MCTCMHFVRFHRVVNPWLTVGKFPEKEFVENLYQSKGSVTMHEHLVQLSHHHLFPTHPPPPLHQRGEGWRATRRGFCAVRPLPHLCHSEGRYAPGGRVRVRVCKHTDSSICLRAQSDNPRVEKFCVCVCVYSFTFPLSPLTVLQLKIQKHAHTHTHTHTHASSCIGRFGHGGQFGVWRGRFGR